MEQGMEGVEVLMGIVTRQQGMVNERTLLFTLFR